MLPARTPVFLSTLLSGIRVTAATTQRSGPHRLQSAILLAAAVLAAIASAIAAGSGPGRASAPPSDPPRPTRVVVLHIGAPGEWEDAGDGVMGRDICARHFTSALIALFETDRPDVIVLKVNGSDLAEGDPEEAVAFAELINTRLKPRCRVVVWIESATGVVPLAILPVQEIFFMPAGNFGALSMGEGPSLKDPPGPIATRWKKFAEEQAALGGHAVEFIRAMQDQQPLSATLDPTTGKWSLRQDEAGEVILNPMHQVLTLTAMQAVKYGFARGIAKDQAALAKVLGITDPFWVDSAAAKVIDGKLKQALEQPRPIRADETQPIGKK